MTFWHLSDGKTAETSDSFDADTQNTPIPNNTQVRAAMDEIKWDEYDNQDYISARWVILDGQFKNRKIFQKIRVKDSDQKKADKALKMLAAIDTNAGGHLMKIATAPTDGELASALLNKPMALKLGVWKIADDPNDIKEGNWVKAVSPLNKAATQQAAPKQAASEPALDDDSDIPF